MAISATRKFIRSQCPPSGAVQSCFGPKLFRLVRGGEYGPAHGRRHEVVLGAQQDQHKVVLLMTGRKFHGFSRMTEALLCPEVSLSDSSLETGLKGLVTAFRTYPEPTPGYVLS